MQTCISFPIEGEPCTEDGGSMSCSANTLLLAYLEMRPKSEYLETGTMILKTI